MYNLRDVQLHAVAIVSHLGRSLATSSSVFLHRSFIILNHSTIDAVTAAFGHNQGRCRKNRYRQDSFKNVHV
ncbi:hypothetical protein SAMN05216190_12924 [Pseudomonas borbori]|uniref:Uncharacterized protein n=1 Tax=Pseudomonas borbori TaxID=289003 RepID=A0A1I5V654_9PSED|nr:hypothetical protein SAMN05216190_12924 [Pseudomonas borbori]